MYTCYPSQEYKYAYNKKGYGNRYRSSSRVGGRKPGTEECSRRGKGKLKIKFCSRKYGFENLGGPEVFETISVTELEYDQLRLYRSLAERNYCSHRSELIII